jgi:hypothetical protein
MQAMFGGGFCDGKILRAFSLINAELIMVINGRSWWLAAPLVIVPNADCCHFHLTTQNSDTKKNLERGCRVLEERPVSPLTYMPILAQPSSYEVKE